MSAPIGVPGPTRQRSSLSSRLSMMCVLDLDRPWRSRSREWWHALPVHRVGDGVFQRERLAPFTWRAHGAVGADLIDAPVDLEVVAVGIAKLHGELTTRATAAFEHDRHAVVAQPGARTKHFVRRSDFEREVVQGVWGSYSCGAPM